MKAIILCGGQGTRLYPLTVNFSKHFQAVYDKPMIYYPLTTLIAAGIREFCFISTPQDLPEFKKLLKSGNQWGLSFDYVEQNNPNGIAEAFILAKDFIGKDNVVLALGDNIFSGSNEVSVAIQKFETGATVFAYRVKNPSEFGIVDFDENWVAKSLEEKPGKPKSNYAVPGLYIYDNKVVSIAENLKPSARGELEITDLNIQYLNNKELKVHRLGRGFAWLDAGTSASLQHASNYIQTIDNRQGLKIGCPEEAALHRGFINFKQLAALLEQMPKCEYRDYLNGVLLDSGA